MSRYIHLNPAKANLIQNAQDYNWSSYSYYLNIKQPPKWLKINEILAYFSEKKKYLSYKTFTDGDDNKEIEEAYANDCWVSILGKKDFKEILNKLEKQKNKEIVTNSPKKPSLEKIKNVVSDFYGINFRSLLEVKLMETNTPRAIAIWLARKVGKYKLKEIAHAFLNSSYSSISVAIWRIKQKAVFDIKIMEDIHKLEKILLEEE